MSMSRVSVPRMSVPGGPPNFVIMGAMKCATTTLHDQLSLQPGVFMTTLKEPLFFSDDDVYARGLDWYLSLFAAAAPDDICGESSTHYTKLPTYPQALTRLQQHAPDVKLIYVMRDPIERLVSQYVHEWSQRAISGALTQAIKRHPELYQYSQYSMQLRPYLEAFGPGCVLPVFFERIKQDPRSELARVGEFIGMKQPAIWQTETAHSHSSRDRLRKSPVRDAIVNAPLLRDIRQNLVPKSVRQWVRGLWQMQERPKISESDRAWLSAKIDPDLALLGEWLGLELSCQNFSSTVAQSPCPEWVSETCPGIKQMKAV
ncbi:MAG: sulfotransferase domain-containing protein [Cyanobacteria bacterium J06650_10]